MLSYEEVVRVLGASFVSSNEESERQVLSKVVDFCSFEKMRDLEVNKTGTHSESGFPTIENKIFFRQGQVGDSRNYLTREMMDELDEITGEKLKEIP